MEWDKRAPSTSYGGGRASERGRSVRESVRGSVRERERSVRGSERERYSDVETVKQSNYPKPRASSKRPKDRSEGYTAKGFDNRGGPPPSKSAYGFADPYTPASVTPSIASIRTRGHKSGTVVTREVDRMDRRYGIDDWEANDAAVERSSTALEQRLGSLNQDELDKRIDDHVANSRARVGEIPALSEAPTMKSRDSRTTRDSRGTRESRPQKRAESVNPSSRVSLDRRSRASSAVPRDRIPVQGGTSFHMTSSTTIMMSNSNANANGDDIHIYSHRRRSSFTSPSNGGGQLNMAQTSGFVSHSGDTHSNSRPSRGRNPPAMIVDYSQAGIQRIRPGDSIGGDTARHRPLTDLPSQPKIDPRIDRRIEDLGSVSASHASESTVKPRRRRESVGNWPFENSESGAKTITGTEASMLRKPEASNSGRTERTERTGHTERTGRPHDLRAMYLDNVPPRADPSVAPSSRTHSTMRPPPTLYSSRSNHTPSTTASQVHRLTRDRDLGVERGRYHERD
ncbi:hypothetical protein BOTCAL_0130g00110 [Botryotinia calthae]|uniref:Uncharacterized protein n=1 Tax=Botryotinia calthae TaxID=38488 RepID=A0A4Y8D3Y7_9HELO|nr:hypothetical protein BOTCAL_0130g00110 [Botryotinia calthae]